MRVVGTATTAGCGVSLTDEARIRLPVVAKASETKHQPPQKLPFRPFPPSDQQSS